jgi:2-dehydropantoate 2-reductase
MIEASVLVVGGGAIGGIAAARMAPAVRRVAVLDTNAEHVARMRDPGLVYEEEGTEHTVALEAGTDPDALPGEFDFALVGVKAPFHQAALEPLAQQGKARTYVSLGNGLIHDRLRGIVGEDKLLACLVEWGGTNAGPGRLVRDTVAPMVVGELDGEESERLGLLARCLEAVGDVRVSRNIRGMVWSKLLVNSTFTGLSAVSGLRYGAVAEHPEGRRAALGIWTEGVAVGEAEGLRLERVLEVEPNELLEDSPTADDALGRMMAIAGNTKPSMLQDLEAGRATEVDVVCGGVAGRGREHGIPTPLNDRVVELVHSMERGERAPDPETFAEVLAAR